MSSTTGFTTLHFLPNLQWARVVHYAVPERLDMIKHYSLVGLFISYDFLNDPRFVVSDEETEFYNVGTRRSADAASRNRSRRVRRCQIDATKVGGWGPDLCDAVPEPDPDSISIDTWVK